MLSLKFFVVAMNRAQTQLNNNNCCSFLEEEDIPLSSLSPFSLPSLFPLSSLYLYLSFFLSFSKSARFVSAYPLQRMLLPVSKNPLFHFFIFLRKSVYVCVIVIERDKSIFAKRRERERVILYKVFA